MTLDPKTAEELAYLADLGWSDLYLPAPAAVSAAKNAAGARAETTPAPRAQSASSPVAVLRTAVAETAPTATAPNAAAANSAPVSPAEAARELAALATRVADCRQCKLCSTRTQTVFASGPAEARLMLVGEGPGAEEDRQGLPFVGAAGELLNKILAAIDLRRDEVYVANVVKCRPPGNRDPEPDEVRACRAYLERQIQLVRPEVLVVLGRVAAQALLGTDASLSRLRGEWHAVQGIPVRVTYHPAALLRNAAWKRPTWEDMQLVRDRLRSPAAPLGGENA